MTVVVLRDRVRATDVRALASERTWQLVDDVDRAHYMMSSVRWRLADETRVSYVEDHTSDVRSLEVVGRSDHVVVQDVLLNLACFEEDELLIDAESNRDPRGRIRALCRAAACRPRDVHHRYLGIWARALAAPHKAVRRTAIRTSYSFDWPDMGTLLQQRLEHEHELREQLEDALGFFAQQGA